MINNSNSSQYTHLAVYASKTVAEGEKILHINIWILAEPNIAFNYCNFFISLFATVFGLYIPLSRVSPLVVIYFSLCNIYPASSAEY